jgi:hypothetical protein
MFQLNAEEVERSRSQTATLNSGRGQNIANIFDSTGGRSFDHGGPIGDGN